VLVFDYVPSDAQDTSPLNYTIRTDGGRRMVDVEKHTSDYERVVLPVQWAVDKAGMEMVGVRGVPTPRQWPYTKATNQEAKLKRRLCEYYVFLWNHGC
jgi:ATP-binding cassette subfamily A (ABC1) protein 3